MEVDPFLDLPINDNDILITTDADMVSLKLKEHVPSNLDQNTVKIFNSDFGESLKSPNGDEYPEIALNTIAMSARSWKQIMECEESKHFATDDIYDTLKQHFSENVIDSDQNVGSPKWSMDQQLFSWMFYKKLDVFNLLKSSK